MDWQVHVYGDAAQEIRPDSPPFVAVQHSTLIVPGLPASSTGARAE
jgi:hypothetical protein